MESFEPPPARKLSYTEMIGVHERLLAAGIDPHRLRSLLRSDRQMLERLEAVWPQETGLQISKNGTGISVDAAMVGRVLGLSIDESFPAPPAIDGEIAFYYDGWSLLQLRDNPTIRENNEILEQKKYYEQVSWGTRGMEPGYYAFSTPKEYSPDQEDGPLCIVTTAILLYRRITGKAWVKNGWIRCAEQWTDGRHLGLAFDGDGRESYGVWAEGADPIIHRTAIRKLS